MAVTWKSIADAFEDEALVSSLHALQQTAQSAGGEVTLLRTLDIAVWMRQHGYQWASPEHRPPDGPVAL